MLARFVNMIKIKGFILKYFKKLTLLCTNYSVNCANKSIKNSIREPFIYALTLLICFRCVSPKENPIYHQNKS